MTRMMTSTMVMVSDRLIFLDNYCGQWRRQFEMQRQMIVVLWGGGDDGGRGGGWC